jgi:hypothetical protein
VTTERATHLSRELSAGTVRMPSRDKEAIFVL